MTALADVKSILKDRGLHLNKKLGQHLLTDPNIRRKIIEMAKLSENDFVIEIGAGMGYMTEEIIRHAAKVTAIEIDRGFVAYLRDRFKDTKNLDIIHGDVLKSDLTAMCEKGRNAGHKIKILGNLPYNINAPIIIRIAETRTPVDLCCFVVQKEVADRYTSQPGTKLYGAIVIYLQYRFSLTKTFVIPKECFFPKPDVESAAITLIPHPVPPVNILDEALFFSIVRTAFSQRRKMIGNSLKRLSGYEEKHDEIEEALKVAGIDRDERPENLPIESFTAIANALSLESREKIRRKS